MAPAIVVYGSPTTEDLDSYIRDLDQAHISGIANEGTNYYHIKPVIIQIIRRLECVYIMLSTEVMNREELDMFNNRLSVFSTINEEYANFYSKLIDFCNHRITLIDKLMGTACEQDRFSSCSAVFRLCGFVVGIFNSLHLLEIITERFLKISPILILPVRCLLIAASYFGYMCLITTLDEYLYSKYVVRSTINMIEEDKKLFVQVTNSLLKKDVMQDFFTEIFSQMIKHEIIKNVNEKLKDFTCNEKIFATVLISNMKRDPLCIQDKMFLFKTYRFSRTEAAENWFNRMPYYIHLKDQEKDMKICEDRLFDLKMIHSTPSQPVEVLIFLLKPSNLPRTVLFGLHSVCLFYEIRGLQNPEKRMLSDDLKFLASHFRRLLESTDAVLNLVSHQSHSRS